MNKFLIIGLLLFGIAITLCISKSKQHNIKETHEYRQLLAENDSLKKLLKPIIEQQQEDEANSLGLIMNGKISIVQIETGYDPYHNNSNLWLPCVTIKFKNISNQNITDFKQITAVFIDNSKGEQIGSSTEYLSAKPSVFVSGTSKQINFYSSTGWYAIPDHDIIAKIFIGEELITTYNIEKKEFDGLIR